MAEKETSCYLSVRIKNAEIANKVQKELEGYGIKVFNPCTITPLDIPHADIPKGVADACYQMMEKSGCTVLIAGPGDDFGRDCAAEIGYTVHSEKPVFIFVSEDPALARTAMIKAFQIHGPDFPENCFVNSLEDLAKLIKQ